MNPFKKIIIYIIALSSISTAMQFKYFYADISLIDSIGLDRDVNLEFKTNTFKLDVEGKILLFKEVGTNSCREKYYEALDDRENLRCILNRMHIISIQKDSITFSASYQYFKIGGYNVRKSFRIKNIRISKNDLSGFCAGPTRKQKWIAIGGGFAFATLITGLKIYAGSFE